MCLIFDRFKTRKDADAFAASVTEKYGRKTSVYDTQAASEGVNGGNPFVESEDSELHDIFPWALEPPIVLVERFYSDGTNAFSVDAVIKESAAEEAIANDVEKYKGVFAGT
jgi:hypothetical protein